MGTIFEENICQKLFLLFFWSKTKVFSKTTVNPYQKNSNMENSLGWVLLGGGGNVQFKKKIVKRISKTPHYKKELQPW